MCILFSVLLTLAAGIFNGSYPCFLKPLSRYNQDWVWAYFSIFAFLIFPLLATTVTFHAWPQFLCVFPLKFTLICIIGGIMFGMGMVCFTLALRLIGIGVSFVLNIAFSTLVGSLLPLFVLAPDRFFSVFGLIDLSALVCFVLSIVFSSLATAQKAPAQAQKQTKQAVVLGLFIGGLSGILCAAQGAAYGLVTPWLSQYQQHDSVQGDLLMLPWLIIFLSAFVPYCLFYAVRGRYTLEKPLCSEWIPIIQKTHLFVLMGFFYYIALVLYSVSVKLLGLYGNVVGWPLLMSAIVLTSNFWSWQRGEWLNAPIRSKYWMGLSLIIMIVAVVLLGWSAYHENF